MRATIELTDTHDLKCTIIVSNIILIRNVENTNFDANTQILFVHDNAKLFKEKYEDVLKMVGVSNSSEEQDDVAEFS